MWADALAEGVRTTCPGVHVSLRISRGYPLLCLIVLPESERGAGLGTRVMAHLTSAADLAWSRGDAQFERKFRRGSGPAARLSLALQFRHQQMAR